MCGCRQSYKDTCKNCGDPCTRCTCQVETQEVECDDPEPCEEIFPAACVRFEDEIACEPEGSPAYDPEDLYPDVIHYIVPDSEEPEEKNLTAALGNINTQLCYLFNKEFIRQFLINIRDHADLKELFCEIVCSCGCGGTVCCGEPSISNILMEEDS